MPDEWLCWCSVVKAPYLGAFGERALCEECCGAARREGTEGTEATEGRGTEATAGTKGPEGTKGTQEREGAECQRKARSSASRSSAAMSRTMASQVFASAYSMPRRIRSELSSDSAARTASTYFSGRCQTPSQRRCEWTTMGARSEIHELRKRGGNEEVDMSIPNAWRVYNASSTGMAA